MFVMDLGTQMGSDVKKLILSTHHAHLWAVQPAIGHSVLLVGLSLEPIALVDLSVLLPQIESLAEVKARGDRSTWFGREDAELDFARRVHHSLRDEADEISLTEEDPPPPPPVNEQDPPDDGPTTVA